MLQVPSSAFAFDETVADQLLRYAAMVVKRGYIHNSLGNIAIRVRVPGYEHGVAYTKHSGVSLEEMTADNVVVTDIPTEALIHGAIPTSVGHRMNREIFRLRPDVNAVIHAHHDETIAFLGSRPDPQIRVMSLEYPYVMGKHPRIVPSHLDVEMDVEPLKDYAIDTNALVMHRHGITTMGRNVSEAYHRLNTLTSEIRRNILVEELCALRGAEPEESVFLSDEDINWMFSMAEKVVYPEES